MEANIFELPNVFKEIVRARDNLRAHYQETKLSFTLDGKLVGDIGEAIAVDLFGIKLEQRDGIDGYANDGKSVQIKATGTGNGPNFRYLENRANHLLFFSLDFDNLTGQVIFNGPEIIALATLPDFWQNQRQVTFNQIQHANDLVSDDQRLQRR